MASARCIARSTSAMRSRPRIVIRSRKMSRRMVARLSKFHFLEPTAPEPGPRLSRSVPQ
jgi:hypothetical protein